MHDLADEPSESISVETEMWGEQDLDEFAESVVKTGTRPTEYGAASSARVEALEQTVADQRDHIKELYEAIEQLLDSTGGSVSWDYDPSEEFE